MPGTRLSIHFLLREPSSTPTTHFNQRGSKFDKESRTTEWQPVQRTPALAIPLLDTSKSSADKPPGTHWATQPDSRWPSPQDNAGMTLQLPQAPFSRPQCLNPITNACRRVTKKSHFSKHYHPPPPLVAFQPRPKGRPRAADETVSDPWAWTTVRTLGSHQPRVLCAPFDGGIASDRRPFSFPLGTEGAP